MLRISGMTSGSPQNNGVPEKSTCSNCHSTKLLILVLFVLYAVCQVQILVNRESSVNVAHILREIQQTSERITDMELSLIKVESTLDLLLARDWSATKPPAHRRTKRQSDSSIRQEMRQLKRYLKHLERRVQCVMSDTGTDARGKPCPGGRGGKTRYLKDKRKEDRTNSTGKPTQKSTNNKGTKQHSSTSSSQLASQTNSRTVKRVKSAVYTYWGSSKCPDASVDVKTVYSGRVATLHSRSNPAVGSEYLCVPDRFEYTDHKNMTSGLYLSPVKYGANMTIFRAIGPEQCKLWGAEFCERWKKSKPRLFRNLDYHQVPCAVCRHEKLSATLVTPARNMCHPGWWKEYYGFLMTKQRGSARSQHICVGADADGIPGSNTTGAKEGPFIQPVAYKCDEPSCPQNLESSDNKAKAITCVVCTI